MNYIRVYLLFLEEYEILKNGHDALLARIVFASPLYLEYW